VSARLPLRVQAEQAMRRQWFPVARSVDLATPQSATLLGERLVVWRTAAGQAVVQEARCPHRGADLALGQVHGDSIGCPYHGWRFSAASGRCSHVPSLEDPSRIPPAAAVRNYPVQERYGHVWTALEDPALPLYDLAEWRDLELDWLAAEPLHSPTGVAVAVENFGDVAHFAFIHRTMMGQMPCVVEPLLVRRDGLDVWMDRPLQASTGDWAQDGDCMMHYHIVAPGLVAITYDYEKLGKRIVVGFPSPVAYDDVKIFWGVANDRGYRGEDLQECLRIEELLYLEDLPTAASIRPREIDWDGQHVEHSVPADLYTLSYRRAFREFIDRANAAADAVSSGAPA